MEFKFIADVMVGKLARYLRMAGYDVLYFRDMEDAEIVERARKDGRVILTRDTLMLQRKDIKNKTILSILVQSGDFLEQLKQVKKELDIELKINLTRCVEDNTLLLKVQKNGLRDKVPPYVFITHENFLFCPSCGRYYWRGTHFKEMEKIFARIT